MSLRTPRKLLLPSPRSKASVTARGGGNDGEKNSELKSTGPGLKERSQSSSRPEKNSKGKIRGRKGKSSSDPPVPNFLRSQVSNETRTAPASSTRPNSLRA